MTAAVAERNENPWWLVLIQGIAALVLGFLLLTVPAKSTIILVQFLGIYWLIDGIFSFIRIFLKENQIHWGWLVLRGVLGVIAGLIVIQSPLWSTVLVPTVLVIILGVQGLITGVIGLIEGFKGGGWGAIILGALSVIFGLYLMFNPLAGALVLPFVFGIFAIFGGIAAIILAFKIK